MLAPAAVVAPCLAAASWRPASWPGRRRRLGLRRPAARGLAPAAAPASAGGGRRLGGRPAAGLAPAGPAAGGRLGRRSAGRRRGFGRRRAPGLRRRRLPGGRRGRASSGGIVRRRHGAAARLSCGRFIACRSLAAGFETASVRRFDHRRCRRSAPRRRRRRHRRPRRHRRRPRPRRPRRRRRDRRFSAWAILAASSAGLADSQQALLPSRTGRSFHSLNRLSSSRNMPCLRPVWMLESMR